jgi:hypothetical protein
MAAWPWRSVRTEQLDADRRGDGVSGGIRPERDPYVLNLSKATKFLDVRDRGMVVRGHGNFNRYRVL